MWPNIRLALRIDLSFSRSGRPPPRTRYIVCLEAWNLPPSLSLFVFFASATTAALPLATTAT